MNTMPANSDDEPRRQDGVLVSAASGALKGTILGGGLAAALSLLFALKKSRSVKQAILAALSENTFRWAAFTGSVTAILNAAISGREKAAGTLFSTTDLVRLLISGAASAAALDIAPRGAQQTISKLAFVRMPLSVFACAGHLRARVAACVHLIVHPVSVSMPVPCECIRARERARARECACCAWRGVPWRAVACRAVPCRAVHSVAWRA